jgi:hypothetical protein
MNFNQNRLRSAQKPGTSRMRVTCVTAVLSCSLTCFNITIFCLKWTDNLLSFFFRTEDETGRLFSTIIIAWNIQSPQCPWQRANNGTDTETDRKSLERFHQKTVLPTLMETSMSCLDSLGVKQCISNCGPRRFARWSAAGRRRFRKKKALQKLYQTLNE